MPTTTARSEKKRLARFFSFDAELLEASNQYHCRRKVQHDCLEIALVLVPTVVVEGLAYLFNGMAVVLLVILEVL